MSKRKLWRAAAVCAAVLTVASVVWAEGFGLGETKEQLGLKYDIAVQDHGTGRVTVTLTIADDGRMKPLESVDLLIPSDDDTGHVDLSLSLSLREADGKRIASVHLKRDLAEKAELHLTTRQIDGKEEPLTWYYHVIRIAEHLKKDGKKAG